MTENEKMYEARINDLQLSIDVKNTTIQQLQDKLRSIPGSCIGYLCRFSDVKDQLHDSPIIGVCSRYVDSDGYCLSGGEFYSYAELVALAEITDKIFPF